MRKEDYEQIKAVFDKFIQALEMFEPERLSSLLAPEASAALSTLGQFDGAAAIVNGLKWNGVRMDVSKQRIFHYVAKITGDIAVQCAYVQALIGVHRGTQLYPFQYGGRYANTYKKTNDGWRITEIKYDHDWACGNSYFVKNWNLVNYDMLTDIRCKQTILSETDAPWRLVPNCEYGSTDEEQVAETFFKYAWCFDTHDFELQITTITEDVAYIAPKLHLKGVRELVNYCKGIHHDEPALHHCGKVNMISIDGDEAVMEVCRAEPHKLGGGVLHIDNTHHQFYSAKYTVKLKKLDNVWKIYEIHYKPTVFYEIEARHERFADRPLASRDHVYRFESVRKLYDPHATQI